MATHELRVDLDLPLPVEEVFAFFARAENLERITPPELGFRIVTPGPVAIHAGALIDYRLRLFGLPFSWRTRIAAWEPPSRFVDEQLRGPYREWVHTHRFVATPTGTRVTDHVAYRLPLWPFGEVVFPLVRLQLSRIFAYRTSAVSRLLIGPMAPGGAARGRP